MHHLAPLAQAERLEALLDALVQTPTNGAFVFGITNLDDDGIEVSVLPCVDPVETLMGFEAPAAWNAVGVIAAARGVGDAGDASDALVVGFTIDRDGNQCSELRDSSRCRSATEPRGRIVDVCRRSLGLRTAAPESTTTGLWNAIWLDRVLVSILDDDLGASRPSWLAIVAMHPAATRTTTEAVELAFDARRRGAELGWPIARRRCAEGLLEIADLDPADAAWMDDGMFSRFARDGYVGHQPLLDDLAELLPVAVARRVRRVVELSESD